MMVVFKVFLFQIGIKPKIGILLIEFKLVRDCTF